MINAESMGKEGEGGLENEENLVFLGLFGGKISNKHNVPDGKIDA